MVKETEEITDGISIGGTGPLGSPGYIYGPWTIRFWVSLQSDIFLRLCLVPCDDKPLKPITRFGFIRLK